MNYKHLIFSKINNEYFSLTEILYIFSAQRNFTYPMQTEVSHTHYSQNQLQLFLVSHTSIMYPLVCYRFCISLVTETLCVPCIPKTLHSPIGLRVNLYTTLILVSLGLSMKHTLFHW
jgi:hypothetical protein